MRGRRAAILFIGQPPAAAGCAMKQFIRKFMAL